MNRPVVIGVLKRLGLALLSVIAAHYAVTDFREGNDWWVAVDVVLAAFMAAEAFAIKQVTP